MSVEEYFPEGLSVIHHDESQREGASSEESPKFPVALHCHVCYKSITGSISNVDYIKPCNCPLMFVHATCASRNKTKFGEAKCSNCGHGSTISRSAKLRNLGKVVSDISCCTDGGSVCTKCKNKNYKMKRSDSIKHSFKVKPCFCRKIFHFGCLRPLINEKPLCSECCVIYSDFESASTMQFFKAKWKWYTLYVTVLAVFTTLFILALKNSLIFTKESNSESDINKEIMLTLFSVFFLVVIAATMFTVIKYTWTTALPKFRITRGKVVLKPYKTGSSKTSRPELEPSPDKGFEEIPLNELRNVSAGDVEEVVEYARGNEIEDMTLGQHMFGVHATHHSSSTPIDKPSLGFVFNSV